MLHFAGGNRYSFGPIMPHFKDQIVDVLELPGRGKRIKEQLLYTSDEAVDDLYDQIIGMIDDDEFLIYGHSMGAFLGLKLSLKLIDNKITPKGLVVTGNPGPGIGLR